MWATGVSGHHQPDLFQLIHRPKLLTFCLCTVYTHCVLFLTILFSPIVGWLVSSTKPWPCECDCMWELVFSDMMKLIWGHWDLAMTLNSMIRIFEKEEDMEKLQGRSPGDQKPKYLQDSQQPSEPGGAWKATVDLKWRTALLTSWLQTSDLQREIYIILIHAVCGTLLWQPEETKTGAVLRYSHPQLCFPDGALFLYPSYHPLAAIIEMALFHTCPTFLHLE